MHGTDAEPFAPEGAPASLLGATSAYRAIVERFGYCPLELQDAANELACGCVPHMPHGPRCQATPIRTSTRHGRKAA
jgi:hypothetical protein